MSKADSWKRWQDWVTLIAGVVLALSPFWGDLSTGDTWAVALIGAAIAVVALIALAIPGAYLDEGVAIVLGVVAFLSPWVFSFTDSDAAAWTAWIVGVVVVAASGIALPISRDIHRHQPTAA